MTVRPLQRLLLVGVLGGWLGFVGTPLEGSAQTILNTERFQIGEVDGGHLSATVGASLKRGNADVLDLSTSGMAGVLAGSHWLRIIFGGRYLENQGGSILDDQFAQLRYSYVFLPELRTFHFVQIQRNETLLLRSRSLVGSGVRWTVSETDRLTFAAGTGLMGEWEELSADRVGPDDDTESSVVRMTNLAVLSWTTESGARLLNILYLQPDVSDFGDTRILNDLGLTAPLTDVLGLTVSLEWRHDTRPPSTLEADDLTLRASLSIAIP